MAIPELCINEVENGFVVSYWEKGSADDVKYIFPTLAKVTKFVKDYFMEDREYVQPEFKDEEIPF